MRYKNKFCFCVILETKKPFSISEWLGDENYFYFKGVKDIDENSENLYRFRKTEQLGSIIIQRNRWRQNKSV